MKLFISIAVLVGVSLLVWQGTRTSDTENLPATFESPALLKSPMAKAALDLLKTLDEDQRNEAVLPFDDDERSFWHFTPSPHRGLTWEKMSESQQQAMTHLLKTGLSEKGFNKSREIMALELVLRDIEERGADDRYRHPELYYFMLFGHPEQGPWGWRFEGHHLSLNYTSVSNQVAVTPAFMGSNPAEVPSGPHKGKRVLSEEEDVARQLVLSFTETQLEKALISNKAPKEIITGMDRKAMIDKQEGLNYEVMNPDQQQQLKALVQVYLNNMEKGVAEEQLNKVTAEGWNNIYFAWAGELARGVGNAHYYRIHGPGLLIEYDNIQNNANHVHAVWRDLNNDFGEDLLRTHHETKH